MTRRQRVLFWTLAVVGVCLIVVNVARASVPLPPVLPDVKLAPCPPQPAEAACTWPGGPIYLDLTRTREHDLWHELGHQFDYQVMHDPQRDKFRSLIDDERPWRSSPNSPHEQFAEAYALCALSARPVEGRIEGGYDYEVPKRRHRRICILIRNAGAIAGVSS